MVHKVFNHFRPTDGKSTAFYLRPKKIPSATQWFDDVAVGIHPLQSTVARLCSVAGFIGNYTNHSLRATAATRLYVAGVDEQLISEKTGHRSNAIRCYKRTSDQQQQNVSDIVQTKTVRMSPATASSTATCSTPSILHDSAGPSEINIHTKDISLNLKF